MDVKLAASVAWLERQVAVARDAVARAEAKLERVEAEAAERLDPVELARRGLAEAESALTDLCQELEAAREGAGTRVQAGVAEGRVSS